MHTVIGAGVARRMGRALDLGESMSALAACSPFGAFAPEGWGGDIYRVDLDRLFAG